MVRTPYANLPALAVEPLPFASVWAVSAWLVPLRNLIRPKHIMDAIWRGSDPDRPRYDAFWRKGPVPALMHVWWAVLVASWLADGVSFALLGNGSDAVLARRAGGIGLLAGDLWTWSSRCCAFGCCDRRLAANRRGRPAWALSAPV